MTKLVCNASMLKKDTKTMNVFLVLTMEYPEGVMILD